MTNTIKVTDTSVEKAIQKGLRQLGLTQEEVVVEEVEEFFEDEEFDIEDNYEAVEVLDNHIEEAAHVTKAYLEQIAEIYGAPSVVHVEVQKEKMNFVFEC